MRKTVVFTALCLFLSISSEAQVGPTDNELKAGYCLGVTRVGYQSVSQIWNEAVASHQENTPANQVMHKDLTGLADRMTRLQSYVVPKLLGDSSMQIAIAIKRGETDATYALQCLMRCVPPSVPPSGATRKQIDRLKSCAAACSPVLARTQSCTDTSWLPY